MECKVWSQFQRRKKDGIVLTFTVLDCPKDRFEDAVGLYEKYFMRDESLQKLSGISKSKEAKEECTELFTEMLKDEALSVVICIENSTNTVAGVSSMKLTSKHLVPKFTPQTKEVAKLFEILDRMGKMYNVPEGYSADSYYDGRGIIVHPDYRGFGIASVFVAKRKDICKDHGVSVTSAWMTSIGTQKAAEKDDWETLFEIDSTEFARKFNTTPYDGIAPTFKVMVKKVT